MFLVGIGHCCDRDENSMQLGTWLGIEWKKKTLFFAFLRIKKIWNSYCSRQSSIHCYFV